MTGTGVLWQKGFARTDRNADFSLCSNKVFVCSLHLIVGAIMSGRGRGIRTHKVELPKPRKLTSFTTDVQQTELERLLAKIKQGNILPDEAKLFNQTLKSVSLASGDWSKMEFLSQVISCVRSSLLTQAFPPVIRAYLLELVELAASGWDTNNLSYRYHKEKTISVDHQANDMRKLQHSLSYPGEESNVKRQLLKAIRSPANRTSNGIHRLENLTTADGMNTNNIKTDTTSAVSKTTRINKLQHSASYPGEETNKINKQLQEKSLPLDPVIGDVRKLSDECSISIGGHILRLYCDSNSIIQEAINVLLSHFADGMDKSDIGEVMLPSVNSQFAVEQVCPRSGSADLWQTSDTSKSAERSSNPDLHVQTSCFLSSANSVELYKHRAECDIQRSSSALPESSGSTYPCRQVVQYGKAFLLACAKSPIATKLPEGWQNREDLPDICLVKPASYFDPASYKSAGVLIPVTPESCAMRAKAHSQLRTNTANDFYQMEDARS